MDQVGTISGGAERLLIIGWDGADWEILDNLIEGGYLPNVAEMRREGAYGDLQSTIPTHSWAAWATFLTGVNCGRHGIYDFIERQPGEGGKVVPVSSDSIRAMTFLERLSNAGLEVRAANIPVTFPPIPVRGRMISGVAIPPNTDFVYPPEWADELLQRAPFPLNGMEWARFQADPGALVDEAKRFVQLRTDSFGVLLEGTWAVAVCVFLAPDRLQHPFGAYLLPSHPRHEELAETRLGASIRDVYSALDDSIGRLRTKAGPGTTTVLMSDHGFRPVDRVANLGDVLIELGLAARPTSSGRRRFVSRAVARTSPMFRRARSLKGVLESSLGERLREGLRPRREIDWSRTLAYQSVRGGGLSINLENREPLGIVRGEDFIRVRDEVREALLNYRDPKTGSRPVSDVIVAEDLYSGPHADLAPDLIVLPSPLWSFPYTETQAGKTKWPSGAHRRQGIVLASGGRTVPGELGNRDIADLAATALAFCGVTAPGIDGRPIGEIAGGQDQAMTDTDAGVQMTREPADLTAEEQQQMAEHLRNLGYIE